MAIVHSFQEITFQHEVPFVVWCYWEGAAMNTNRAKSFAYLVENIEVPVLLVTRQNLHTFISTRIYMFNAYNQLMKEVFRFDILLSRMFGRMLSQGILMLI